MVERRVSGNTPLQWLADAAATASAQDAGRKERTAVTILELVIAFFFPALSVLLKKGPNKQVLLAFVLQLLGHVPGVIYGLYVVIEE